jgi:hypothetical protein
LIKLGGRADRMIYIRCSGWPMSTMRLYLPWPGCLLLRLAETGEDIGRLVRVVDEGRTELLTRALQTSDGSMQERVDHAIAQFRARAATVHDKRSAVLTLAGILEERRELISEKLATKDEGMLFDIANNFAIRHQRRGQHGDYDPVFLDWIFWLYLSTVELTNRLLACQDSKVPARTS